MKKITDLIVCWFGAGVIYAGLLSAAISDEPVPNPAQAPDEAPGPESYSDNQYPLPRATGQLSFITAGAFYPYGPDQIAATEYWGLRHTDSWSDILVRGEKTGKLYMIANDMIRAQPGASLTAGLSFGYESAPDNMKPTACHKPWTGEAPPERIEGDNVVRTAVNADGQMEVITYGPEILSWKTRDSGHVDLEGTLATPGSQFLLPWRDATGATSAMVYQKQYYSVQGTYCGETVKGHVMIENIWGDVPYSQSWWVQNRVGSWASFITEYDDGTRESGTFLCGEYAAKGALIVNDKGEVLLNTTEIKAEEKEGRLNYTFGDGQNWEFVIDPEGAFNYPTVRAGNGLVQRVGEQRKIINHSATMQINRNVLCSETP